MTDDLADRAIEQPMFTVFTEPPSLLHLGGELDMAGAPALTDALEPLTSRGGIIGMDLTRLTFMDSTGINALCQAAQALGERGRIVVLNATQAVRRVIEIAGLGHIIDIDDDSPPAHRMD